MTESLAIVSGKGGSGKTLVATAFALEMARLKMRVLLIDADLGTSGLSYYLGFKAFAKTRGGFAEFVRAANQGGAPCSLIVPAKYKGDEGEDNAALNAIRLLPSGDNRFSRGFAEVNSQDVGKLLECVKDDFDLVIFDCRGGIDEESLAICRAVSGILMVVETDAAAVRSSQHLSNVLSEEGVHEKVHGFVLNKVMDDPTELARAGITFFETQYLGAIPFDIQTTRDFIKGNMPRRFSLFQRHVGNIARGLILGSDSSDRSLLRPEEFGTITLRDPDIVLGGAVMAFFTLALALIVLFTYMLTRTPLTLPDMASLVGIFTTLALLGLSDGPKSFLGKIIRRYVNLFGRTRR